MRCVSFLAGLFLTLCAGCTTDDKPQVAIVYKPVPISIPAALLVDCPPNWSTPGGPATTEDFVIRGDVNAAARNVCNAQVRGIRALNASAAADEQSSRSPN